MKNYILLSLVLFACFSFVEAKTPKNLYEQLCEINQEWKKYPEIAQKMNFQNIPFTDIVKFGQINMLERPLFSTSWILGRFCNYKCSYCWPHARSDALDFFKLEDYKRTIDQIKQQARNNGFTEFHWGFSGGEPTAYKDLLNLIKHLDDGTQTPYQSVHMTTNLSPGKKWWANWLSATELLQRKGLTASYHAEFADESEFIDKCLFLIDGGVLLTVNQVMVPEHFWEYYERAKRLADNGINVTIKPQSDPTASFVVKTYTPEMINILQTEFPQQVNGEMSHQVKYMILKIQNICLTKQKDLMRSALINLEVGHVMLDIKV
jgi:organic radical activating enzyme